METKYLEEQFIRLDLDSLSNEDIKKILPKAIEAGDVAFDRYCPSNPMGRLRKLAYDALVKIAKRLAEGNDGA